MRRYLTIVQALVSVGLVAGLPLGSEAQEPRTTISGTVRVAASGEPVEGAFVVIEGTDIAAISDSAGAYRLTGVPPGPVVLRVQRIGFAVARVPITVPVQGALTQDVRLAETALEMEELTVTVDYVSRATGELGTASVIDLPAIQNQTATSLAGVLELVPGVELQPPGLGSVQQFGLRAAPTTGFASNAGSGVESTDLASFGTTIILDGVPVSNNANLQTLGPRAEVGLTRSARGGIDLRRIPASTIERVEVIRGLPSARYGDLTQGAVVVETRAGAVPPELRAQFDARTLNGALVWGAAFGGPSHNGTLTFDVARTEIRPGVAEDDAWRLSTQLSHRLGLGGEVAKPGSRAPARKLTLDSRVDFWQLFEDLPQNPNVRLSSETHKRDWGLRLSERATLKLGSTSTLDLTGSIDLVTQNSETRAEKNRGAQPVTDRLTEGRQEGFFVIGPYEAEVTLAGGPRQLWGRLEYASEPRWLGFGHRLRAGFEPRREWNAGEGIQFDVSRPLQSTFTGVRGWDRPRSFENLGALATSALYVDDRIAIPLGDQAALQLQGGLRLDVLHDGDTWFSGIREAFLQPRFNAELSPLPWLRFRGGWGRTAKAPSLLQLFPPLDYYDIVNVNQFTDDPAERLAVITTFIRDGTNEDLGWIRSTKAEVGVEFGVAGGEFSVVAFRDRIDDAIGFRQEPSSLPRDHYALTDSIPGNGIKPEIIEPPTRTDPVPILVNRPAHIVEQVSKGLEFTATLPEISALKTRIQATGGLVETEQHTETIDVGPLGDFNAFQLLELDERHPFWDPVVEFGKRALIQYRVIHHQPQLGLVLNATIQHNIVDEEEDIAASDTLAFAGYMTREGELVRVPEAERGNPEYQDLHVPRRGSLFELRATPADWMMSVQVSKSLPLNGRLNFWAFNLLDRRGIFGEPDVRPRVYSSVRFGVEVLLPLGGLLPGAGG